MKCFAVDMKDLNGILSPSFYVSKPKNNKGFIGLSKIADINPSRRVPGLNLDDDVPYVGLPETGNRQIEKVLTRPYKEVKGRRIIKAGDILFARIEPSIFNKKYIFVSDLDGYDYAFTSTEFYVVKANENINSDYLFFSFFFDSVYNQVLGKTTGSTGRRRLDRDIFETLLIPYPDRKKQDEIASILSSAYQTKKQKEQEAEALLNSIDDYVLDELGIKLPEFEDRKCVTVSSDEVKGSRLDPYYYQPKFMQLTAELEANNYPLVALKDLSTKIINGLDYRTFTDQGIPYLRVSNIRRNKIETTEVKFIPEFKISKAIKLNEGDLLITRKGSYGVAVIVGSDHKDFVISSEIFLVGLKNESIRACSTNRQPISTRGWA